MDEMLTQLHQPPGLSRIAALAQRRAERQRQADDALQSFQSTQLELSRQAPALLQKLRLSLEEHVGAANAAFANDARLQVVLKDGRVNVNGWPANSLGFVCRGLCFVLLYVEALEMGGGLQYSQFRCDVLLNQPGLVASRGGEWGFNLEFNLELVGGQATLVRVDRNGRVPMSPDDIWEQLFSAALS
jgi:hypothetical protein